MHCRPLEVLELQPWDDVHALQLLWFVRQSSECVGSIKQGQIPGTKCHLQWVSSSDFILVKLKVLNKLQIGAPDLGSIEPVRQRRARSVGIANFLFVSKIEYNSVGKGEKVQQQKMSTVR